jgi:very-short-patch-repair endonuclease
MSLPEVMLWRQLRQRPGGLKFRRQHPIGDYVVDFCCLSKKLVIEVDGAVHGQAEAVAYDERRDARIRGFGFEIVRIAAKDVLKDTVAVAEIIVAIAESPLHQPLAGSPPRSGEDL